MNTALAFRGVASLSEWIVMATAILLLARLMTTLVRRNAAMSHLIWLIAFSSLLATPLLVSVVPGRFVVQIPVLQMPVAMSSPPSSISRSTAGEILSDGVVRIEGKSPADTPRPAQRPMLIAAALLGIWLAGVGVVGIMGGAAACGIRRIRRHSVEHTVDSLDLPELTAKIGLKRSWKLRVSLTQNPAAAMTWGFLHPVILLPKDAAAWSKDRREAVLLHELAHVRRYDSLSQWLSFAVCALYWFHPAVWRFARAMRAEAELAADDAVLMSGLKPSAYAAELLRFAAELGQNSAPFAYAGVSFMRQSRIANRIESILNADRRERELSSLQSLKALAIGCAMILFLATLRPSVSVASEQRVAPAPAAASASSLVPSKPEPRLAGATQSTVPAEVRAMFAANPVRPVAANVPAVKHCHKKLAAKKSVKAPSAG